MSTNILIRGMGAGSDAKALSKQRASSNAASNGNGTEGWMAEMSSALQRSGRKGGLNGSGHDGRAHAGLLAEERRRETVSSISSQTNPAAEHLVHASHLSQTNKGVDGVKEGHAHTSHDGGHTVAHAGNSLLANGNVHSTQQHSANASTAGGHASGHVAEGLHGLAAQTHHDLTHQGAHASGTAQKNAQVGIASVLPASVGAATAAIGDSAGITSPADALAALLRAAQASGDITEASLRVVKGADIAIQDALDVSGATRRKLMDALQDLSGASAGVTQAAEAGVFEGMSTTDGSSAFASPADAWSLTAEALSERPVAAAGDLAGFFGMTDKAPGAADSMQGAASLAAVNADLDWMAVLEQQAGISRLREADSLRLDLQLQDSQRVSLEASMQDGVLTVRLGARSDGSFWVAPEQMEALKASLRMATPEVQEVVFEQSADLGSSLSERGSGDASDSRADERRERANADASGSKSQGGFGRRQGDGADTGGNGAGVGVNAVTGMTPETSLAARTGLSATGGVSLRA
jgi:hypothetical protein